MLVVQYSLSGVVGNSKIKKAEKKITRCLFDIQINYILCINFMYKIGILRVYDMADE